MKKLIGILILLCACQEQQPHHYRTRFERSLHWFEVECNNKGMQARCISVSDGTKLELDCFCEENNK